MMGQTGTTSVNEVRPNFSYIETKIEKCPEFTYLWVHTPKVTTMIGISTVPSIWVPQFAAQLQAKQNAQY